jgi:hypothetical protein
MRGTKTQKLICEEVKMSPGNLSTFVKNLAAVNLLTGDSKLPKLAISIPSNFFDNGVADIITVFSCADGRMLGCCW